MTIRIINSTKFLIDNMNSNENDSYFFREVILSLKHQNASALWVYFLTRTEDSIFEKQFLMNVLNNITKDELEEILNYMDEIGLIELQIRQNAIMTVNVLNGEKYIQLIKERSGS